MWAAFSNYFRVYAIFCQRELYLSSDLSRSAALWWWNDFDRDIYMLVMFASLLLTRWYLYCGLMSVDISLHCMDVRGLSEIVWVMAMLCHYSATRSYRKLSEAIGSYRKLSEAIGSYRKLSEAIGSYRKLSEAIGSYPKLSEAIGSYRKLSEAIGSYLWITYI